MSAATVTAHHRQRGGVRPIRDVLSELLETLAAEGRFADPRLPAGFACAEENAVTPIEISYPAMAGAGSGW